jgi:hypothetical protein
MGDPHLEHLTMRFISNGSVSDEQSIDFGIREITSGDAAHEHRMLAKHVAHTLLEK